MRPVIKSFKIVAVFLGPSLPRRKARCLLQADYYPPAKRGDIYRILASGVRQIVLIDGIFHSAPTIWQREILDAIEEGIQVVGAASMGALRAAELHEYGMIGHGTVFEWYRDGIIEGDDEVALLHGTAEFGFRPLTEPLVNMRYTLQQAVKDRCLEAATAQELLAYARRLHYSRRSYQSLLECPILKAWPKETTGKIRSYFSSRSIDIKKLDAIESLLLCARGFKKPGKRKVRPLVCSMIQGSWWGHERLRLTGFVGSGIRTGGEILRKIYTDGKFVKTMRAVLSQRQFILEWAAQNGISVSSKFVAGFTRRWEHQHQIRNRSEWLRANGLTSHACRKLLRQHALLAWITKKGPAYFGCKKGFVLEWARQNGVTSSPNDSCAGQIAKSDFEMWIVKQGPLYFGVDWNFETALLQELQISGKAAAIVSQLEAE